MSDKEKKEHGYVFRIGCQTADGITIDVTGNLPIDCSEGVASTELDKWINVLSRQRARTVLMEEKNQLDKDRDVLTQLRESLRLAEEKNPTKTAEKQQMDAMRHNIAQAEARIAAREKGIASLEKLTV